MFIQVHPSIQHHHHHHSIKMHLIINFCFVYFLSLSLSLFVALPHMTPFPLSSALVLLEKRVVSQYQLSEGILHSVSPVHPLLFAHITKRTQTHAHMQTEWYARIHTDRACTTTYTCTCIASSLPSVSCCALLSSGLLSSCFCSFRSSYTSPLRTYSFARCLTLSLPACLSFYLPRV